ncbi:hypothetical protein HDV04_000303 [Boothiomyces sp. JEL0838]|nr:hypothetical protein HDV04_000303 [Boothiomyces sp. JEL0838]
MTLLEVTSMNVIAKAIVTIELMIKCSPNSLKLIRTWYAIPAYISSLHAWMILLALRLNDSVELEWLEAIIAIIQVGKYAIIKGIQNQSPWGDLSKTIKK